MMSNLVFPSARVSGTGKVPIMERLIGVGSLQDDVEGVNLAHQLARSREKGVGGNTIPGM